MFQRHIRVGIYFIRQFSSINVETTGFNEYSEYVTISDNKVEVAQNRQMKSLRIAMLGAPNAGKSTLVNQLTNRMVCATSSKVHTTKSKCDAVYTINDTQLVFIDTPGVIRPQDRKKYALTNSFQTEALSSLKETDLVAVVHDAFNVYTRENINSEILEMLSNLKDVKSILLILNKVDRVKKKHVLLKLVKSLTSSSKIKFSDVFMVSALSGDGVHDLRNYFLDSAVSKDWQYESSTYTDQSFKTIIQDTIRGRLLDSLPNEVPYKIKVQLEYLDVLPDGTIFPSAALLCRNNRIVSLILGKEGSRVKKLSALIQEDLRNAFRCMVMLKLHVRTAEKPK